MYTKLEDLPEDVQALVRANKKAFDRVLDAERTRIFNHDFDLIPVSNTDPFDVYQAACHALGYLKAIGAQQPEALEVVKRLEDALKLEGK